MKRISKEQPKDNKPIINGSYNSQAPNVLDRWQPKEKVKEIITDEFTGVTKKQFNILKGKEEAIRRWNTPLKLSVEYPSLDVNTIKVEEVSDSNELTKLEASRLIALIEGEFRTIKEHTDVKLLQQITVKLNKLLRETK